MTEQKNPTAPEGAFHGLQSRAIALGVVVDHVSSLIYSTMLVAIVASEDFFSKDAATAEAAREALAQSPSFLLSMLIGGSICTVLAAFVGARYAGERYVIHGVAIAIASSAVVLIVDWGIGGRFSWFEALGWFLVLPAGWMGGALARWAIEQQLAEESDVADE